jgi:hypothetical protein
MAAPGVSMAAAASMVAWQRLQRDQNISAAPVAAAAISKSISLEAAA